MRQDSKRPTGSFLDNLRHMLRALRGRNYSLFFVGQGLSLIGTWMQNTAMAIMVWQMTHRPQDLGMIGFAAPSHLLISLLLLILTGFGFMVMMASSNTLSQTQPMRTSRTAAVRLDCRRHQQSAGAGSSGPASPARDPEVDLKEIEMAWTLAFSAILILGLSLCGCSAAGAGDASFAQIRITQLPPLNQEQESLPVVKIYEEGDPSWWEGVPTFELTGRKGTVARGHFAATMQNLLLQVVVSDSDPVNHSSGEGIWEGDSLQVGINARGDGASILPSPESRYVGPNDASFTFALTDTGPQAFAHYHGQLRKPADMKHLLRSCSIVRDDEAATTTYRLALPWKEFAMSCGLYPTVGISVMLNCQDGPGPVESFEWGVAMSGVPRPGLFKQFRLGPPPGPMAVSAILNGELWDTRSAAEIRFATNDAESLRIAADFDGRKQSEAFPATPESLIRRFVVRAMPSEIRPGQVLAATVSTGGGRVLLQSQLTTTAPADVMDKLHQCLGERIRREDRPILLRHFRSLDAIVRTEWAKAALTMQQDPMLAQDTVHHAQDLLEGINGDAGQWETYRSRRLQLVMAYLSRADGSLAMYKVTLPAEWDPAKSYPMIVLLHGAGPPQPLQFAAKILIEKPQDSIKDYFSPEAYVVEPWGRGNRSYLGAAEDDVFEAMADAGRQFHIDPDRVYLCGTSMGGGGALMIALRSPDRFAAVAVSASATWSHPSWTNLCENVTGLPIRIWHGLKDHSVPASESQKIAAALTRYKQDFVFVTHPDLGHTNRPQEVQETHQWLLTHRRTVPRHFSFLADASKHLGRNGITMKWDLARSTTPRFECDIDAAEVRINATGTAEVEVDMGRGGLGLQGDVKVLINGKEAYSGPVKKAKFKVQ